MTARCTCGTAIVTTGYCCSGSPSTYVCGPAFFVSPAGSDSNDGTSPTTPFKTLARAQAAMRASSSVKTVYLMAGSYDVTETLQLAGADSGESWLGYPGETPVLEGNNSSQRAIDIGGDDITIRWLVIQNFTQIGIAAANVSNVTIDSNTIKNITSTAWGQSSIEIAGTFANGRITHNLVRGSGYCGIEGNAFAGDDISNVLIDSNAVYDTMLTVSDGGAIYFMDRGHSGAPMTISNNVIGGYGNLSNGSRAIYLDDMISNVTVENNIAYGSGEWTVMFHGGDRNVFRNNIFDISQAAYVGIYQDCPSSGDFGMNNNEFTCNIVYSSAPPPYELWDYYTSGSAPIALPNVHDNVYWGTNGALPNHGTIVDSSPIQADPHFLDPANANYGFQYGPPAACFQVIDPSHVGPLPH